MSKLIKIPYENLPDFNAINEAYQIRYRLKSDDGNRVSAWSPIYSLNPGFAYTAEYDLVIEKESGGYTRLVWDPVKVINSNQDIVAEVSSYDVWTRYSSDYGDTSLWNYQERVGATSLNIFQPPLAASVKYISVEIYAPTVQSNIMRRQGYDVYQDHNSVDLIKDKITFVQNIPFVTGQEIKYTTDSAYKVSGWSQTGNEIGGLVNGSNYYVRIADVNAISLYPTEQDATNDTNKIDLTSVPNAPGYFAATSCTLCNYLLYSFYYASI